MYQLFILYILCGNHLLSVYYMLDILQRPDRREGQHTESLPEGKNSIKSF